MNFFERQDRARRRTRWLIALFLLAVIGIVLAVNALVLSVFGVQLIDPDTTLSTWLSGNASLIAASTLITIAVIGLSSTYRTLQLRGGGGALARELGGTLVEPGTSDPLRRRLHNIVEEMAIASGIPVPETYVLEHEQGINAFAAGFSTSDAAIAVTRGTLESLDRDELQGVVAHEFSHVFNGDMRLNLRLIGILFGILVIAIIGRKLLHTVRYTRDSRNAAPAVMIGLAVVIIGYVGLFFGRWIKAAVSRQREYLADASAVQFTRQPDGIGGALKKIAASYAGSFLSADSEEVGHMLFARGMGYQMFATHPPIEKRILAIDPSFEPGELKTIAERMQRHVQARRAEVEQKSIEAEATASAGPGGLPLNADQLAEQIGQPGLSQIFLAAALAAAMPPVLKNAAHSDAWAREVICALVLSEDSEQRESQLLKIAQSLGSDSEAQVRVLGQAMSGLAENQRLPLAEMAFPALRRHPEAVLVRLLRLIDDLIHSDGTVNLFEYALARLIARQIEDILQPKTMAAVGSARLDKHKAQACDLLAVVAGFGHPDDDARAHKALADACRDELSWDAPPWPKPDGWQERLDRALKALLGLRPADQQRLVAALARVILFDRKVTTSEIELARLICGTLRVPLPVLSPLE